MNYYTTHPMLEYLLIVGDVNGQYAVPTFTINSYNESEIYCGIRQNILDNKGYLPSKFFNIINIASDLV